jgi:hypothetical protein
VCDAAAVAGGGADDDDGKWTAPRDDGADGHDHDAADAAAAAVWAEYCISHSTHCAVARTAVGTAPREIHADTCGMGRSAYGTRCRAGFNRT